MQTLFLSFISLLFLCISSPIEAQQFDRYRIKLMTESISIPFSSIDLDNVGFEIGTNLRRIEKDRSTRYFNANLGVYVNRDFSTTLYLLPSYEHQFHLGNTIRFALEGGIGAHYFNSNLDSFKFEDGEFSDSGKYQRIGANVQLNGGLIAVINSKIQAQINYGMALEYPFAPGGGIPILPRTLLQTGISFQL